MRGSQRHTLTALLVAFACALWLVPLAAASGGAGSSGVYDQYTEQIPTASGPHNTGSGGSGSSGGTGGSGGGVAIVLPASLTKDGGKDAKKLRDVATSERYGAPSSTASLPEGSGGPPSVLSSAVNAISAGSDGRILGLFVALLAVTAVSLGTAAATRQRA